MNRTDTLRTWTWPPTALLFVVILTIWYGIGLYRLWKQAGIGHGVSVRQALGFVGAILTLIIALFSPMDALSDELFSAHMVQHMVLMFITAPLLTACGLPVVLLWTLPRTWAHQVGSLWTRISLIWRGLPWPLLALGLFTLGLWVWHIPSLYDAALHHEMVHAFEHVVFLSTSMLYWWIFFQLDRSGYGIVYLFGGMLETGALGALLTFSSQSWYPAYAHTTAVWGISPLDDQQLGGVIMWVPGYMFFFGWLIVAMYRWLISTEQPSSKTTQSKNA